MKSFLCAVLVCMVVCANDVLPCDDVLLSVKVNYTAIPPKDDGDIRAIYANVLHHEVGGEAEDWATRVVALRDVIYLLDADIVMLQEMDLCMVNTLMSKMSNDYEYAIIAPSNADFEAGTIFTSKVTDIKSDKAIIKATAKDLTALIKMHPKDARVDLMLAFLIKKGSPITLKELSAYWYKENNPDTPPPERFDAIKDAFGNEPTGHKAAFVAGCMVNGSPMVFVNTHYAYNATSGDRLKCVALDRKEIDKFSAKGEKAVVFGGDYNLLPAHNTEHVLHTDVYNLLTASYLDDCYLTADHFFGTNASWIGKRGDSHNSTIGIDGIIKDKDDENDSVLFDFVVSNVKAKRFGRIIPVLDSKTKHIAKPLNANPHHLADDIDRNRPFMSDHTLQFVDFAMKDISTR